jgi:pyrroline-5-carboxylate reductase
LHFRPAQVVHSVMAGVPLARVRALVAPATRVAVAIPLPSVAARRGGIPVHPALPEAVAFWSRLGEVVATDEEDVFAALIVPATTIAAYFEHLEVITRWVVDHGVATEDARRYVAAVYAAVAGQLVGGADFGALAAEVATPGGLNAQLSDQLRAAGVPAVTLAAMDAVHARLAQT